jgi:ubiquinone/menaquinone biosynthesis C-methylase UbiE
MKPVQDNFSAQAGLYQKYRPVYPGELYAEILKEVKEKKKVWDCGTGNGQVAYQLASYFEQVYATDISEKQLAHGIPHPNIRYQISRAEQTHFHDKQFDLITVAQAIHWFDFELFYKEVNRTDKPGGILAIWGYGLLKIDHTTDTLIDHFYRDIVGPYWDKERRYIDEGYQTIPFSFREIPVKKSFPMEYYWSLEELLGYLNTWSSVQQFISDQHHNPVELLRKELSGNWLMQDKKKITFPLFVRMGLIE